MTPQPEHVGIEDLAAYAAGDLDATAAVGVEAHLVLCADCRADVEAVNAATAALANLPAAPMPEDVAARVETALAAAAAAPLAAPVVAIGPRRRRPSFAGIAAVAAGVALVAGIAVPMLRSPSAPKNAAAPAAPSDLAREDSNAPRRLASGLDYSHANLAATLSAALGGRTAPPVAAGSPSGVPSPAPGSPEPTSAGGVPLTAPFTTRRALASLESDPGRFAACVTALVGDQPAVGRTVLFADFARYGGRPAVVLGFPNVYKGAVRPAAIDVWVVGPGCGAVAGGDVLDFARIDRPGTL